MPAPAPFPSDDRPLLLFVDDEERILRSLKFLFQRDYRVLTATRGSEALALLREQAVDVLICDQRMPEMSGVDVLRQARDIAPDTMRMLLTGYSDIKAVVDSINEGEVFRYLHKPWDREEIRRTIASAAEIARSLRGMPHLRPPTNTGRHCILLIDGQAETLPALRAILAAQISEPHDLYWAASIEEALSVLETREIALVISELKIGEQDTAPFLKTLKHCHPQIVTLVLSTFQDGALLVDMVNRGQIHRFLPKPIRATMTARGILSGLQRHREIRFTPALSHRHRVPAPARESGGNLVQRLRNIARRIGLPTPN